MLLLISRTPCRCALSFLSRSSILRFPSTPIALSSPKPISCFSSNSKPDHNPDSSSLPDFKFELTLQEKALKAYEDGKDLEALDLMRRSFEETNNIETLERFFALSLETKQHQEGINLCNALLENHERFNINKTSIIHHRAELLHHKGDLLAAIKDFEEVLRIQPNNVVALQRHGFTLLSLYEDHHHKDKKTSDNESQQILDKSYRSFDEAFKHKEKKSADLLYGMGKVRFYQRKVDEALVHFNKALEADPTFAPTHILLGDCYSLKSKYTDAISSYTHFFDESPKFYSSLGPSAQNIKYSAGYLLAESIFKRGICQLRIQEHELAHLDFDFVINVAKEQSDAKPLLLPAYQMRARANIELGSYWKAVEDCSKALRLNNKSSSAYRYRSEAYERLGIKERAEEDRMKYTYLLREQMYDPSGSGIDYKDII